jgi:hypothetical protein
MRLLSPNSLKVIDHALSCPAMETMLPGYSAIHFLSAGGAEPRAFGIGVVQGVVACGATPERRRDRLTVPSHGQTLRSRVRNIQK